MSLSRRGFLVGAAALVASRTSAVPAVTTGLDTVAASPGEWKGRRVGILAHAASLTADGRHVADVLRHAGARAVRLFAPEHGVAGKAAAGAAIADGVSGGIPVVSLYGARPARDHFVDLDVLVVDLQDAGVRFYTYAATMLDALGAATCDVVVLDRPNPLGGLMVDGPVADDGAPASIFNRVPGPLVHGLTMGEIARMARPTARVVGLQGWSRSTVWAGTGLPWRPPSPNLRTAEAAHAYPGTALLEATNVSEGRGTEAPFLVLGAPWLDESLAARVEPVAGFELEPTRFTPQPGPAAPTPKHSGVPCRGVRVHVRDASRARPLALGLSLLHALRRLPSFAWRDDGHALDRLVASRRPRALLDAGQGVAEMLSSFEGDGASWRARRASLLLY